MARMMLGVRTAASWLSSGDSHGRNWVFMPRQLVHKVQGNLSSSFSLRPSIKLHSKCRNQGSNGSCRKVCLVEKPVRSQVTSFSEITWVFLMTPSSAFLSLSSLSSPVCDIYKTFLDLIIEISSQQYRIRRVLLRTSKLRIGLDSCAGQCCVIWT